MNPPVQVVYSSGPAAGQSPSLPARRPCIVHMVEAFERVGGPPKLVRQIVESPLREKFRFHVLSYTISGISPRAIWRLRCQLRELAPDIVHVHGLKADGFHAVAAALLAHVKRVLVTVHGTTLDAISEYRTPDMRLRQWIVGHVLEPLTLRMADSVYCVCEAMKRNPRIRRHAGRRLGETIHNGIEPRTEVVQDNRLRGQLGLAKDDTVLIYIGRMSRDKGLAVLATVMQRLALFAGAVQSGVPELAHGSTSFTPTLPSKLRLLLVGDGAATVEMRACFQSLVQSGHVIMAGRRDDVDKLNAISDIFVLPSFHENLSFALLEAMNAGLPVITTSVGGNPEVVIDGITGLLVPPHDDRALEQAIVALALDVGLRARLGSAGRQRVRNQFDAGSMIRKTGELYRVSLDG